MKTTERSVSDYCFLNDNAESRLSEAERLTVLGGSGLDRLVTKLGRSLGAVTLDTFTPGLSIEALKRGGDRLDRLRAEGAITPLFNPPTLFASPTVTKIHGFPEGEVVDLEFESEFPPRAFTHDPEYSWVRENQRSFVRFWEHSNPDPKRKTIVAIHGWTMGDQRVNSLAFLPGLFFSLGYNVALIELPFHGRRQPTREGSTSLFPSADPLRTCVGVAHAISDLRVLARYLKERGHGTPVCLGMSLGAYIGLLWCSLDALHKGVFMVPLVSMGDMACDLIDRKGISITTQVHGVTREYLRALFGDHLPLRRDPATPQESILVIGGQGDHLVPAHQISLLQERWPRVTVVWASGGHGAPTQKGLHFDSIQAFLKRDE